MTFSKRSWSLSLLFMVGCAAQPGERLSFDELQPKQEALVGASCTDDAGCAAHEYCNRIVCITTPCPDIGTCQDQTRFYDNESADIPDNDPSGLNREIVIDRPASNVATAHVSVNIDHTWQGDLRVVLTSPAGTEHVLHDRTGGSADDLNLGVDVTESFDGETAVGTWTLHVSDNARRDTGRLLTWRLQMTFAEPTDPEPDNRVWANLWVPAESEHDYRNDTDQTWDLRPYSGGAARSRITFSRIDVERGYDVVEVVDLDTDEVLDRFSGSYEAFTTREYETGNLGIHFVSDYSVTDWGFHVEQVEVFGLGCLEDSDCGDGYQCPTELVRCIRYPCFLSCVPERTSGEGGACSVNDDCDDSLYCATDGTCHAAGSCSVPDDCTTEGNAWIHVMCAGYATCNEGSCGWSCGVEPMSCVDGETRDDGCNTCSCFGGRWACTERYCPPVVGLGETCGSGTLCEEGLVCDQGWTEGPTCSSDTPGTCQHPGPVYCRQMYNPVCTCNGQTFDNECSRFGSAPYAYDGECVQDIAIPDADPTGIARTIEVLSPAGSTSARVTVRIEHTWRGDLVAWIEAPDGSSHPLTERAGGSADDFEYNEQIDLGTGSAIGTWTLHVSDHASWDTGVLRFFNVIAR